MLVYKRFSATSLSRYVALLPFRPRHIHSRFPVPSDCFGRCLTCSSSGVHTTPAISSQQERSTGMWPLLVRKPGLRSPAPQISKRTSSVWSGSTGHMCTRSELRLYGAMRGASST
eukprot:4737545-Pleurochrysis_carterae.AAC.3